MTKTKITIEELEWGYLVTTETETQEVRKPTPYRSAHEDLRNVLATIAGELDGKVWLHLSFSRPHRMPSYEDMLQVKKHWIGEEHKAIMVFPPREFHVSIHDYCLHLWCCLDTKGDGLPEFSWGMKELLMDALISLSVLSLAICIVIYWQFSKINEMQAEIDALHEEVDAVWEVCNDMDEICSCDYTLEAGSHEEVTESSAQ